MEESSEIVLELSGVTHRYPRGPIALQSINLRIGSGITGLVGANGAGKSTLMRVATGSLRPTNGSATVDGKDFFRRRERSDAMRRVAWMPQSGAFPTSLTAVEFVAYLSWLRGVGSRVATSRAREALTAVELGKVADRRMSDLSGGMVRRVWLAQALAADADLLVLDEPSAGLDPRQRATMVRILQRSNDDRAVLLSSHILEDVASLADRVIVMDHGVVVYDGPVPDGLDSDWFLAITAEAT